MGKPGQRDLVAPLEEPARVVTCRSFGRHLVIKTDHGAFGDQPDNGFGWPPEQQAKLHGRDGGNVGAAAVPQFGAQHLLVDHALLRAGKGDGTTMGRCQEIL